MKISITQTFAEELHLHEPQARAKHLLLGKLVEICDKIFVPQREVLCADETVQYSLDFHILADHELRQIIQNSYNLGQQCATNRVLH